MRKPGRSGPTTSAQFSKWLRQKCREFEEENRLTEELLRDQHKATVSYTAALSAISPQQARAATKAIKGKQPKKRKGAKR